MNVDQTQREEWIKKQRQNAPGRSSGEPELPLYGGGGGGPMEPGTGWREYVDKADEAVESRLNQKLDKLATKGTVWGAAASALGVVLAVLAFGGDRFEGGMSVSPIVSQAQQQQAQRDESQDARLTEMDDKLDVLISRTEAGDEP